MDNNDLPLHTEALPANQQGQLTEAQQKSLGNYERSRHQSARRFALIPLAIAAIILFVPGANPRPLLHYGIPFACIIIAFGLVGWSFSSDRLAQDLRDGRVESLAGAIEKRGSLSSRSSPGSTVQYTLYVGDRRFNVARYTYRVAPDAGYVRIYYLPRSKHVVNLERLEGRPDGGALRPQDVAQNLKTAYASHDRVQRNEALADVQSVVNQVRADFVHEPIPPADAVTSAQALADELIGTWRNPMLTLTFHMGGAVEAIFVTGKTQSGHWSVDGDGHLHSNVTGHEGAADAWITGNQLTITLDGNGLTFERVAGETPAL